MFRTGAIVPAIAPAPSRDAPIRRLACGLLLSLLAHALILSLQFGLPGMALQGVRSAISVTLAPAPPVAEPAPEAVAPASPAPEPGMRAPARAGGMTIVDPQARPATAPRLKPQAKRRKARRVSTPLAAAEAAPRPRVITQDSNPGSDFAVPLPQPEEAVQKTIDPAEAQHGSDEAAAVEEAPVSAAETVEPVPAARAEQEEQLRLEAARGAAEEQRLAAEAAAREREVMEQQRVAQEVEVRRQADELLAQQRKEQQALDRQKYDELLAQQRREAALAERARMEEQLARQRIAQEQAERRVVAEEAERQQRAREQAERRRLDELDAQRRAQEAARQQALRQREQAQAAPLPAGDPFGSPQGQGGSGRAKGAAGNYGSDLANRVRDLSKGLDLLGGAPPAHIRADADTRQRRVVADSAERDVPLRMYVESWRQKIERNGSMNFPKGIADRARIDPLVSVAVRSDGSIEDVTIVRSSGRADTDEAVRRIVRINALYAKFPPNVAARYDVIEIRRIWTFDQALKLIEEVR